MKHLSLITALLSFLLIGGHLFANRSERQQNETLLRDMTTRVGDLSLALATTDDLAQRLERTEAELRAMGEHLETLRAPSRRAALAPPRDTEAPAAPHALDEGPPGSTIPPVEEQLSSVADAEQAEFAALFAKLLGGDLDLHGSPEDLERFWQLARETDVVDAHVAELEQAVEGNPAAPGLRMSLARAYVAKLFTVPGGPEQGLWGQRAEQQWQSVLELDPEHWEAQFTLANNWGYYPDFVGKTGDAIAGLERAREIQERSAPDPQHAQTYLSLSRLYQRRGDREAMRSVLETGLEFFPDDERLLEARAELDE